MHFKLIINCGIATIVATILCLPLVAQEKTDSSPLVGSWKWERNGLDGNVRCVLQVQKTDDDLTGSYTDAEDVKAKVGEIGINDGVVSFKLVMENDGKTSEVSFSGKLKDGKITGKMIDSQGKELNWTANRFTSLAEAAGKWRMEFTTPDGTSRNPEFTLKEKDGKPELAFDVQDDNAGKPKVTNIEFEDGVLTFDVTLDFQGQELLLEYEMEIDGDELDGSMFFEFAENAEQSGDVDLTGMRIK